MSIETDFDGSRRPYMRLWINDIKGSTADWTCAQFGAHMRLLMAAWERGYVPTDEKALKRICRDMDWDEMPEVLERWRKVTIDGVGEVYINARLERERERMINDRKAKAENGRKGGLAKAKQTASKDDGKDLANDVANDLALPYSHSPLPIVPCLTGSDVQTPIHSLVACDARPKRRARSDDPLRWSEDTGWVGITDEDYERWADLFPAVDSPYELKRLDQWLRDNPTKAHKSHWRRWLNKLFAGKQDKGGSSSGGAAAAPASPKPRQRDESHIPDDCHPDERYLWWDNGFPFTPNLYRNKDGQLVNGHSRRIIPA